MATPTYTALATYTVPSGGVASVTFASIPGTYRDLVLIVNCKPEGTGGKDLVMKFNGDSSNYSRVLMYGDGSSTVATTASSIIAQYNDQNDFEIGISHIMDYSQTNHHKTVLTRTNDSDIVVSAQAQRWASTAAITSINLAYSVDIAEGSVLSLYGIVS